MENFYSHVIAEKIHKGFSEENESLSGEQFLIVESPIGPLTLVANDNALLSLDWGDSATKYRARFYSNTKETSHENPILLAAKKQLEEYFSGQRKIFDLPLAPTGTDFQKRAWKELLKIPYGKTITYGEQARRLKQPQAARAVGGANGKNPIGIIIPCHRVIGASGDLTGFAGGVEMKKTLLAIEGITPSPRKS